MGFIVVGRRQSRVVLLAFGFLAASLVTWGAVSRAAARGGTNPDLVWYVQTDEPVVALTFDDGPDPKYTPMILDTLQQYGAKATFFVIGRNVEANPEIARRIVREGHEIGNHTYSHPIRLAQAGSGEIVRQLERTADLVATVTGARVRLFRPPGGAYTPELIATSKGLGYEIILWSWTTNPSDAYSPGRDRIIQKVTANVAPGDIILLHDGNNHGQTAAALPEIIRILRDKGYRFVTVGELLSLRSPRGAGR